MVPMCFLPLLRDLTLTATYSWGGAVLAHTYSELCRASLDRTRGISGCITLIQVCNNWECVLLCMEELGCLCHYYSYFDLLRSLRLVGWYICICCILGRPLHTKETLPDFVKFSLTQYKNFIIFTHFLIILYSAMVMGETARRAARFWATPH